MRDVGVVRRVRLAPLILLLAPMLPAASAAPANAANASGLRVIALQRQGSSGAFTHRTIFALVGAPIHYRIRVTNTGSAALKLSLNDPLCDPGTISGPTQLAPRLRGRVLMPGGKARYACSHLLTHADASPFVNTATVTGQPSRDPTVSATSSVTADKQALGRAIKLARKHRVARKHRDARKRRHARHRRERRPAFTG